MVSNLLWKLISELQLPSSGRTPFSLCSVIQLPSSLLTAYCTPTQVSLPGVGISEVEVDYKGQIKTLPLLVVKGSGRPCWVVTGCQ